MSDAELPSELLQEAASGGSWWAIHLTITGTYPWYLSVLAPAKAQGWSGAHGGGFFLFSFGSLRPRLKGAAEGILPCQAEEERHRGST